LSRLQSTVARTNERDAGKAYKISGISHEPNEPIVKTAIPGPKSLALTKDLDRMIVSN
jgi:hypothetical protein